LSGSGGNKIIDDGATTERQTAEIAAAGDNLQQIDEFFDRDPRAFDESSQGSSIKLFMIGDGKDGGHRRGSRSCGCRFGDEKENRSFERLWLLPGQR